MEDGSMIEYIWPVLYAVGFGLGVSMTLLGLILQYQIYIKGVNFKSSFLMTQVAILLTTVGTALLFLVLG